MFKRKISGFFTSSSEESDLTSSEENSSWRKNISPLPHFLLNPKKNKNLLFPDGEEIKEFSQDARIAPKKKQPENLISSHKDKTFRGTRLSSPLSSHKNKGYTFTMTKLSMWTVAFSLFLLGVLFFILGFLVALYLMSSKPTLVSKIEHSVSEHDKFLEPKPTPQSSSTSAAPAASSSETGSLSMDFKANSVSSQGSTSTPAAPAASAPSAPSASQPTSPVSAPPASPHSQPAIDPSKLSPLQKNKSVSFNKGGNNATLSVYSLQFGSFTTKDEALKRVNELISLGYNVVIVRSVNNQNKLLFSVISGAYQTHAEAENALQALGAPEKSLVPIVIRNNPAAVIVYP